MCSPFNPCYLHIMYTIPYLYLGIYNLSMYVHIIQIKQDEKFFCGKYFFPGGDRDSYDLVLIMSAARDKFSSGVIFFPHPPN